MSEDYISRKVLKARMFDMAKPNTNKTYWDGVDDVGDLIDTLPSVQPIRPKGEWISYHFGTFYVCSCCNERNNRRDKFCPNCGADMRGASDE